MENLEVELKAGITDPESLIKTVLEKGGRFLRDESNEDIYYNHPSRDFVRTDEAFRIRTTNGRTYYTYKGPKIGTAAKSRVEKEVEVVDYETARDIVILLGFRESGKVSKQRKIYTCGDITICFDNVKGLGGFIEIEMTGNDREALEKKIHTFAAELGITGFERRSYLEMILE